MCLCVFKVRMDICRHQLTLWVLATLQKCDRKQQMLPDLWLHAAHKENYTKKTNKHLFNRDCCGWNTKGSWLYWVWKLNLSLTVSQLPPAVWPADCDSVSYLLNHEQLFLPLNLPAPAPHLLCLAFVLYLASQHLTPHYPHTHKWRWLSHFIWDFIF